MSEKGRVYGIDLGTTYSCIAYVDEYGKPVVLPNSEGQLLTPSVVYFETPENVVVGNAAKEVAALYPDMVLSNIKRVMGDPDWSYEYDEKRYHPQEISSFILRKLIADAQAATGDVVKDVVITCPAYFGVTQKEATRQAGELAGLNVRYIIPEPTAAALTYGMEATSEQVVLVYDLGGGTFDITIMEIKPDGDINVVCTGGDDQLGGKNWDEIVAMWFAEQFAQQVGISSDDLINDSETWQELMKSAEEAKISLSSRLSCPKPIRYKTDRVVVDLSREKFNELTAHLLERTINMTDHLLEDGKSKGYDVINKFLLVGGSTYMPQIKDTLQRKYLVEMFQYDPNLAVAKGAAIYAYKCQLEDDIEEKKSELGIKYSEENDVSRSTDEVDEEAKKLVADDYGLPQRKIEELINKRIFFVASKSFGILVMDKQQEEKRICNLVKVNERVPVSVKRIFGTYSDFQDGVSLECFENSEESGPDDLTLHLDSSKLIGSAYLDFKRPLPKESPVEVMFSLSDDGMLKVYGKDLTTEEDIHAEFKTEGILSQEDIKEKLIYLKNIPVT